MLFAVISIIVILYFVERFFRQYGFIFVIIGIGILVSFVAYRVLKSKKRERDEQDEFEKAVILPPVEPESISGSFKCPSCGAYTSVEKEMYPSVNCRFCAAPLTSLIDMIRIRDDKLKYLSDLRDKEMQKNRQELLAAKRQQIIEEKAKTKREIHKNILYLIISIVAIVAAFLLMVYIFPIALDRAATTFTTTVNHLTDRIFK